MPRLRECDSSGIIGELSRVLRKAGAIPDLLPFYQAAINREVLQDSALDCGVAVPHVRLPGNRRLCFALGRTVQPVSWSSGSSWQIQFVFLVSVPATDAASYLRLLAAIAGLGHQPEFLCRLREATSAEDMLQLLESVKL